MKHTADKTNKTGTDDKKNRRPGAAKHPGGKQEAGIRNQDENEEGKPQPEVPNLEPDDDSDNNRKKIPNM